MIKVFRWIISSLLILIFLIIIVVGTPVALFSQYFINSQNIKELVEDSSIYTSAVDIFADIMEDRATSDPLLKDLISNISDPDSKSREMVDEIFTEQKLAGISNSAIDQTYDFLSGKSATFQLNIQLIESKEKVVDIFVETYRTKFNNLPPCTDTLLDVTARNIYDYNCVPNGLSFNDFESDYRNMVVTSGELPLQDILDSTSINTGQILSNNDASRVQLIFSILKQFTTALIIAVVVLALMLILLIPGLKTGAIITGIVTFLGGLILFVLGTLSPFKVIKVVEIVGLDEFGFIGKVIPYVQNVLSSLLNWFYGQFSTWGVYYMVAGVVLSGIAVLISFLGRKNSTKTEPSFSNDNNKSVKHTDPTFAVKDTVDFTKKETGENSGDSLLDEWKKASDGKSDIKKLTEPEVVEPGSMTKPIPAIQSGSTSAITSETGISEPGSKPKASSAKPVNG